ncbi:sensor histidine kinase [Jatrophihabitans sp. YIM 134969]
MPGARSTPRSLLVGLLRDGASAAVAEPRALPEGLTEFRRASTGARIRELLQSDAIAPDVDDLPDIAPRLTHASGDARSAAQTAVLRRASRLSLLGPLVFRILAVAASLVTLLTQQPLAEVGSVLVIGLVLIAVNVVAVIVLLARVRPPSGKLRRWLFGDVAFAVLALSVTSLTVPTRKLHLANQVSWTYLVGSAVLWTVAWGAVWGFGLVIGSIAVHPFTSWLNHLHDPDGSRVHPIGSAVQDTLWMLIGVLTALLALLALGIGTRLAMAAGIRAGREVERTRLLRGVHDTVLQTLEVAALATPDDRLRPATTLTALRRTARAQAGQLRRALDSLDEPLTGSVHTTTDEALPLASSGSHVVDELGTLVDDMALTGFMVELVIGDLTDDDAGADVVTLLDALPPDGLSDEARAALVGATREALRNSHKHSGTEQGVVYVDRDGADIRVVVRDHGCGFDPAVHEPGFGTRESIHRRLVEAGGRATITSRQGRGTRVTLRIGAAHTAESAVPTDVIVLPDSPDRPGSAFSPAV